MFQIDFGEAGGGAIEFRDTDRLLDHLKEEASTWTAQPAYAAVSKQHSNSSEMIKKLRLHWTAAHQTIQSLPNGTSVEQLTATLASQLRESPVVSTRSPHGQEIIAMLQERDYAAAAGAVQFQIAKPGENAFGQLPKSWQLGALRLWATGEGLFGKAGASARTHFKRSLEDMQARVAEHRSELEAFEARQAERVSEFERGMRDRLEKLQALQEKIGDEFIKDRGSRQGEWEELRSLFIEQLKLRAAVQQWQERAEQHRIAFVRQRGWALGVGIGGLAFAMIFSWSALTLARRIFVNFAATAAPPADGALRATWLPELIFSASATLLYLTLFLWVMRIMVRSLMAEQHLATDASARASMAHTYLALKEEGAVSDSDRAIVLASLFRPVRDGIVADDALPLVSPATILSAQLAGQR